MEPERADQGGETAGAASSAKRPYRRPEVRRLGTVRELTFGGGSIVQFDGLVPTTKTAP